MKKLVILSFSVMLLTLSVFVVNAATFEGPPSGCTSPVDPNCNLEGVIWNRATNAPQSQDASYYISGNSRTGGSARVGNGLTVDSGGANIGGNAYISGSGQIVNGLTIDNGGAYISGGVIVNTGDTKITNGDLLLTDKKAIHVDLASTRSYFGIGNYSGGSYSDVEVTVFGTLKLDKEFGELYTPEICLNGDCISTWPSGGGGLTQADADDLYVNVTGDSMTGALFGTQIQANTSISSPVYYSGTYGVSPYSRIFYDEIILKDTNGRLDVAANSFNQVAQTWDGHFPWSLDMRSLSNYNTTIGQVVFGAANNAGYFMRYIGANSANVGIVDTQGGITFGVNSNVPATNAYAGRFSGGAGLITLGGPSYTLDTSGTANFSGQVCLGGTCLSNWPAGGGGDITAVYAGSGLSGGGTSGDATLSLLTTCANGQLLKWNGSAWVCATDVDTNSGGDITSVTASPPLSGGGTTGALSIGISGCSVVGQVLKWNGSSWACDYDIDTDTNSGGDITGVGSGNGLTGGSSSGYPTLHVGSGNGITVAADTVSVDTTYLDGRYVNKIGNDSMTGTLNTITNRSGSDGWIALQADGAEAIWYNGTYFSWGYGGTSNMFADPINITYTGDASTAASAWGALKIGDEYSDHLRMDSNEIFAMQGFNMGELYLNADGGTVVIGQWDSGDTISPSFRGGNLVVGRTDGAHIEFDSNEIQAKANGTATADLYLNALGGYTRVYNAVHSSDRRLKHDINPMDDGLNKLMQLKPVTFIWNNTTDNKVNLGFIAQDVKQVIPELVSQSNDDGYYYLDYNGFVPILVNSIKEQELKIQMLEKRLEELENK